MKIKSFHNYSFDAYLQAVLSAVTLFYVLYFFKAYQIETCDSDSGHSFLLRCTSFALLNGLVIYGSNLIFDAVFSCSNKKSLYIKYAVQLLLGSLSIFLLFNFFWNWTALEWYSYQLMFVEYALVMLIPFALVFLIKQKLTIGNEEEIVEVSAQLKFMSSNGKDFICIKEQDFLFVKAAGNYIEVYFLEAGTLQKKLLRCSMKTASKSVADYEFCKRVHRGYLVNITNVDQISGTKGKMELHIKHIRIPISTTYEKVFV